MRRLLESLRSQITIKGAAAGRQVISAADLYDSARFIRRFIQRFIRRFIQRFIQIFNHYVDYGEIDGD